MSFEDNIFKGGVPDFSLLEKFGFVKSYDTYTYNTVLSGGDFRAEITVDSSGRIKGVVTDLDTQDEYNAFRNPDRTGEFVGRIREEYSELLQQIKSECFIIMPFLYEQSNRIAKRVFSEFGDAPDYPFEKLPEYGVFRNSSNNKWYALIMNVSRDKLTHIKEDKNINVEILNVKAEQDRIDKLTSLDGVYPCYHMSKGNWVTVLLDNTVEDDFVMELINESKRLTGGNKAKGHSFIIPANPKYYDIESSFKKGSTVTWKQGRGICRDDTVYVYVGSPVSAIRYKCRVLETNVPYDYDDGKLCIKSVMKLLVLECFDRELCTIAKMREYGVVSVRGARYMPVELEQMLNNMQNSEQ